MSAIWIDALEFESHGGWASETQFAHEMGQGYLLAIGRPGVPVEDAATSFVVPEEGMYRLWVRTKNWLKDASPGRFRLLVDGKRLPREMGKLPTGRWHWDIPGDVQLSKGRHTLRVQDTSGWFARFAAVIITSDMDFTPSPEIERLLAQRRAFKNLPAKPAQMGEYDVIVAGGGPGGVPAAVAAARKGMRVALLQARPGLGGNGSDEAGVCFSGSSSAHSNMRESGIAEEFHRHRAHHYLSWQGALEELVRGEENLTVFYNQFVVDAVTDGGRIRAVETLDVVTSQRRIYEGKYFIDCTGDGWLGYYAGAAYRIGREAKWQYGESLAPETPDQETMSGCLMGPVGKADHCVSFLARDSGAPAPFCAPHWAVQLPEELHREPSIDRLLTGTAEWWVENPTELDDLWEQEEVRDELLRLSLGYFHWLKNDYAGRALIENHQIIAFPRYNAKRENRRLMGDYVLTQDDCLKETVFDDVVSYTGWPLDIHHPKGIYSGKEGPYFSNNWVPITGIPFRCLYSKNVENLLMASRCASVSHLALGTTRVQNTIAAMGQVAGTAAALCIRWQVSPRGIYQMRMEEFQHILRRDDLFIPWLRDPDPRDLAPRAQISATSVHQGERFSLARGVELDWERVDWARNAQLTFDPMRGANWLPLDVQRACFVLKGERPKFVRLKLKNAREQAVAVRAILSQDHRQVTPLDEALISVPPGFEGWVEVPLDVSRVKAPPYGVALDAAEGLFWRSLDLTYAEMGRMRRLDEWTWHTDMFNALAMRCWEPASPLCDCSPGNVVRGNQRYMSPERYAWVSDPSQPLPQGLQLAWADPVQANCIQLTFDTDMLNPGCTIGRQPIVPRTIKRYVVEGRIGGEWAALAAEEDNYLRHRVHRFPDVCLEALRVTVQETWGDPSARIFDVRVYKD